jgi:RNA polymerase sigma-70 factor (ECF subfamily)
MGEVQVGQWMLVALRIARGLPVDWEHERSRTRADDSLYESMQLIADVAQEHKGPGASGLANVGFGSQLHYAVHRNDYPEPISFASMRPALGRWMRTRFSPDVLVLFDVDGIIHEALIRAVMRAPDETAFLERVRVILFNRVHDYLRRVSRNQTAEDLAVAELHGRLSPLEEKIGRDRLARYERSLSSLPREHYLPVVLHVEFDCSADEIAEAVGWSAKQASMAVAHGIVELAVRIRDG